MIKTTLEIWSWRFIVEGHGGDIDLSRNYELGRRK